MSRANPYHIPGLAGIEHIGVTVPDFEAAVDFFVTVLGCRFVIDGGWSDDAGFMRRQLGVAKGRRMRWGFVRCGNGPNIEIFQYEAEDQSQAPPRNSDIGGHHLCFYVEDFQAALEGLKAHGIAIMGEPQLIADGPAQGSHWVYFTAPWGLQLELVSYPNGKGAENSPARALWRPSPIMEGQQ
jgi:catechol 2,3-dioxygenase-like lactoylglutathione lyase family enzyme